MKPIKSFSLVVLLIISTVVFAGDKKSNYSGTWTLNKEKTPSVGGQIFLSKINFILKNDSLLTVRTYENNNGETYPFNENLTMDAKEYKIIIYEMPRKSKAYWSEQGSSLVIESTTTFTRDGSPQDLLSKETWKMDENGTSITVDYTTTLSTGVFNGTYFFQKAN
jgi:hypothetical protein